MTDLEQFIADTWAGNAGNRRRNELIDRLVASEERRIAHEAAITAEFEGVSDDTLAEESARAWAAHECLAQRTERADARFQHEVYLRETAGARAENPHSYDITVDAYGGAACAYEGERNAMRRRAADIDRELWRRAHAAHVAASHGAILSAIAAWRSRGIEAAHV